MPLRREEDARRAVLNAAADEACGRGSRTVEAEHLLMALAADDHGAVGRLLSEAGLDREGLEEALSREIERSLAAAGVCLDDYALPVAPGAPRRAPRLAASSKRALHRAAILARARAHRRIASAHLLVGILQANIGTVPRALEVAGVDRGALLVRAERLLG